MFVAHIFGGYLSARQCLKSFAKAESDLSPVKYYVIFGLLCSILPDIDLLYFYFLDHRQHPHHSYWTHMPIFWIGASVILYMFERLVMKKKQAPLSILLLTGAFLHLILDSVAGGIYWLFPWSETYFRLFTITPRFDWWVLNYIIHWTFLLEILIISVSVYVMRKDYLSKQLLFSDSAEFAKAELEMAASE